MWICFQYPQIIQIRLDVRGIQSMSEVWENDTTLG